MSSIETVIAAGPKIVVKIEPVKEKTEGGIILTETTTRRQQDTVSEGFLIALGEIAFLDMFPSGKHPKIGDKVYFIKFAGKEIKRDDDYYRIINDEDVYAYEVQ